MWTQFPHRSEPNVVASYCCKDTGIDNFSQKWS